MSYRDQLHSLRSLLVVPHRTANVFCRKSRGPNGPTASHDQRLINSNGSKSLELLKPLALSKHFTATPTPI
jgi:hypothetical protein